MSRRDRNRIHMYVCVGASQRERNYFSIDFGMCLTRFFDLNKVVHVCVCVDHAR